MSVLLKPYESVGTGNSASRFYLADCLEVFQQLPAQSVDVIVTSPPYNLGIQYSRYQDSLSPAEYLEWTNRWVAAAARVLRPDGSLFLNVGAKPTDPWTALDVAQAVRSHLRMQNIIHWIKSIAIDRESAGAAAGLDARSRGRPLQADQQRPVRQRLPRVHFSLHAAGIHEPRSARARRAVSGSVERGPMAGRGPGRSLPRQYLVHPVRNDPASRSGPAAPGDLSVTPAGAVPAAARAVAHRSGDGSVHGARQHGGRLRPAGRRLHRGGSRRSVSEGGG